MLAAFLWKKQITFRFYTFKGFSEDGEIFYVSLLLPPALQNQLRLFRFALPTCDNLIQRFFRQLKLQGHRFKVENDVLYPQKASYIAIQICNGTCTLSYEKSVYLFFLIQVDERNLQSLSVIIKF